ncbi:MAG: SPOR domain-containing protein [Proteobacteria bacterium]|nr:SPOR domain-containing protein [Pseudomonadota bacterium]
MKMMQRLLLVATMVFTVVSITPPPLHAGERIIDHVESPGGESFFAAVDTSHRYAINLQSTEGDREFSINLETDKVTSRISDQGSELLGKNWSLRLDRKVKHKFVGGGKGRKVIIQIGPEDTDEAPPARDQSQQATEPVENLHETPGIYQDYRLYATKFKADDGKVWNRLRLGFFPTREEALAALENLRKPFPDAWVTKVSGEERTASGNRSIATGSMRITPFLTALEQESEKEPKPVAVKPAPPMTKKRVVSLMDEAEKEMIAGNYQRSILIYTRILQDPGQSERKKAQELLGFAREQNGQLAHARAEYEKFLQLYPEGEDSERVRQRLAGLLTARATPREPLKKRGADDRTDVFGSVSQYYYYDELSRKEGGKTVTRSALANDLVFNVRKKTADYESRTLFVGGYELDGTPDRNETRISTFYIDAANKKNISGRIGRQSRSTGGVLGRFDGGLFSYSLSPKLKANLVGGFPVDSSGLDRFETDKYFYGASFDLGPFAEYWNSSVFFINQEEGGVIDRQAAGGEIRFFHPRASFFTLVDYDLYFDDLNTALFTGSFNFPDKTIINLSADYRNSPILTSNSALAGIAGKKILRDPANVNDFVMIEDLEDLKLFLSDEEIRDISGKKNFKTSSYSLGIVRPISKKIQLGLDTIATKQYSAEAFNTGLYELLSDGTVQPVPEIPASPETPFEYTYTMQLIGSNLVKEGDIAIIAGSYSDRTTQEVYSASVNTRYPISRYWRINPRINATYSKIRGLDTTQLKIRPLFRMDYRLLKPRIHLTFEAGMEWINHNPDDAMNTVSYFGSLGYRYDF